jgi:hypothetical protein
MSDWIEWKANQCPVFPDVKVDVKIRSGKILEDFPAGNLGWGYQGDRTDIVAYRIREQEDAPEPDYVHPEALYKTIARLRDGLDQMINRCHHLMVRAGYADRDVGQLLASAREALNEPMPGDEP